MLRIAIVENEAEYAAHLITLCERYGTEKQLEVQAVHFSNPIVFLDKYRSDFDIVLMDILMPEMDGMTCAAHLREMDEHVVLCFVTNMAQYAIRGYEVGAFDFIIKPVSYEELSMKLERIQRMLKKAEPTALLIKSKNQVYRVDVRDLLFVEVYDHNLIYHTQAEQYEAYGKLSSLEADARFHSFIRVSHSHLVNGLHVSAVMEDELLVGEYRLPLSRRRKKECLEKLAALIGGVRF